MSKNDGRKVMKQKIWEKIIALTCILALILPISSEVIAAIQDTNAGTKLNFGISLLHKSQTLDKKKEVNFGYAPATSQHPAYRVYSGNNDYGTTVLCLNKDLRYPQENNESNAEYTSQGTATRETLKNAKSGLTDTQADEILWLVRNAVIPEDSDELKDQKLTKIFDSILGGTTENKLTLDEIKSVLTEDDLVFALQFSIWKLTNGITWGAPQGTEDGQIWDELTGNDMWGYQGKKGTYIQKIVQYYTEHQDGEDIIKIAPGAAKPEFEDTTVQTTYQGKYAYIGPFKIKETDTDYSVKITLYKEDGTELPRENFYLRKKVSEAKEDLLDKTKKDLNGTEFYIQLNQTSSAKKVKIELTTPIQVTSAEGTVWTRDPEDQPLLSIKRTEQPGETVEIEKQFDITPPTQYDAALRKNIATIYRKEGSNWKPVWTSTGKNRQPTKQPTKETDSPFNKYDYYHAKDPVEVKVGDIVVYDITVINEGKDKLRVTRIEDYLPPSGLRYLDDTNASDSLAKEAKTELNLINSKYWTPNNSKNGATSTATENTVLDKDESTYVKIACEVTSAATGKVITNIAEITQIADESKEHIDDIDSTPGDIQLPQNEQGWQSYKGNDNNDSDLSKTDYYYKGQQDDDDFEKIKVKGTIDLALRKSITTIDGSAKNREKEPDTSPLKDNDEKTTTSKFTDTKTPASVKPGDVVVYNIRIFNEGQEEASAGKIEDYIPEGLGFLPQHNLNTNNGWVAAEGATSVKLSTIKNGTQNLSQSDFNSTVTDYKNADVIVGKATIYTTKLKDTKIPAYNVETDTLSSKEVQIACIVLDTIEPDTIIKNISAITEYRDSSGSVVTTDVDSNTTDQINPDTYPSDNNIQDDDDFEKLILAERVYDLALKKFITGVTAADGTAKTIPDEQKRKIGVKDVTSLKNRTTDTKADAEYEFLNKEPVEVEKGDYVTYTIRVFNEGAEDAIVKEVVDTVPDGLEFVTYETNEDGTYKSGSNINFKYGWKEFSEQNAEGWQQGIRTTYLKDTKLPGFDINQTTDPAKNIEKGISYADVQIEFKVVTDKNEKLVNIAEITDDDGDDNDSTPNNKDEDEDDEDYDVVIPQVFDLALRKFITKIDEQEVTDRIPKPTDNNGKIKYEHPKDPKIVTEGQTVIYTIRVYNEGTQDGYAAEIKDDLPEGITFLPEHETNKEYGWKMYDEEGKETTEVSKAKTIRTTYLSKEESDERNEDNLIKAFDSTKGIGEGNPDYRDVKVAFEVTLDSVTAGDKIIINTAEISKDEDKDGKEVEDIDSTPDNDKEDEDDIDKEYLQMKYFDLSLLKYVSKVIITEDGVVKEIETGYDGTENPEPIVKVELNRKKLDKTEVKYIYSIKITNEGEIEGYATEISDRIPAGLAFYEEDNTEYRWKVKEEGIVATDYLKDTLLKPGESAIVPIVLRWERSETNLGQKVNVAEITEDYNEYGAPDIDSTPNNNKDGEDDQDEAIVVLSISTGSTPVYIVLITSIGTLMVIGIYGIHKFVLKK